MSGTIEAEVRQVGPSVGRGAVRGHELSVDRPEAKGGTDAGPMGGELLLLGLAGCFLSNLLAAIRAREAAVSDVRVRVRGEVGGSPERFDRFVLHVAADYEDRALMEKLCTIAERACLVANTLRAGSAIEVVVEA